MGTQSIYLKPTTEKMLYDYAAKEHMTTSQVIIRIIEAAVTPEKRGDIFDQPKAKRHRIYTQDGQSFATHREAREYLEAKNASRGVVVSDEEAPAEEAPQGGIGLRGG